MAYKFKVAPAHSVTQGAVEGPIQNFVLDNYPNLDGHSHPA